MGRPSRWVTGCRGRSGQPKSSAAGARGFDSTIVGTAEKALAFIGKILESSTEYSMIGKDLDGKILNRASSVVFGMPQ